MLSSARIELDFSLACRQAERLEELAEQLSSLSKHDLDNSLAQLHQNWQGKSANAFLHQGGRLKASVEDTEEEIRTTARTIRAIAHRIYETEMAALRIAQTIGL